MEKVQHHFVVILRTSSFRVPFDVLLFDKISDEAADIVLRDNILLKKGRQEPDSEHLRTSRHLSRSVLKAPAFQTVKS